MTLGVNLMLAFKCEFGIYARICSKSFKTLFDLTMSNVHSYTLCFIPEHASDRFTVCKCIANYVTKRYA